MRWRNSWRGDRVSAFRYGGEVVGFRLFKAQPMSRSANEFVGDIPTWYDSQLGPNIFADYAGDIAGRAAALNPARTLELAAGTGIVSRRLRDAITGALSVTDLNAPMLEVAKQKVGANENVRFEVANAMALPFEDGALDLVVCQFGVMFFPDKVASFREALRVLRPGGRYLFNAWGTQAQNPFARIAHEAVMAFFPDDPPGFYLVPFSYADRDIAIADLRGAGFCDATCETLALQKHVHDVGALAHGLVFGNPLIDEVRQRGGDPETLVSAIEARFRREFGGERATMPLLANVYSATRG